MHAPIILFTYSRVEHTQQTVDALLANTGASEHDLIVYSDAPRSLEVSDAVFDVRNYLETISGFRSVTIHHRRYNYGLSKSIIEGLNEVLINHERVIVLEDDIVTSPHFLNYMNDALERFANDERVISVHGYVYPTKQALPEAFFIRGADCWGWATWRRGWSLFNADGQALLDQLMQRDLIRVLDFNGAYPYSKMLKSQIDRKNDSWAIRWYASALLADKLTLYPGRSLVQNIGNDSSGTHSDTTSVFNVNLSTTDIQLDGLLVEESELSRKAIENFLRKNLLGLNNFALRLLPLNIIYFFSKISKNYLPSSVEQALRKILLK